MIRVRASSRLHFGLLQCGTTALSGRRFGGAGLMIDLPGVELTVQPADRWAATGPSAERALTAAQRFVDGFPAGMVRPHRIVVERCSREHVGLGTGTQLTLSVGRALAESSGLVLDTPTLADRVGRGRRSALGLHGFRHGGFLIDGGKRADDAPAPLVVRHPFPEAWRIVLLLPRDARGRHGAEETQAFERLDQLKSPEAAAERLCRLLLLGMLPALVEQDLKAFGEALFEYNARSGELFASVQGGTYADPRTAAAVATLRQLGVFGVGQSSWGPAVFAITASEEQARELRERLTLRTDLASQEISLTRAANAGATVTRNG